MGIKQNHLIRVLKINRANALSVIEAQSLKCKIEYYFDYYYLALRKESL